MIKIYSRKLISAEQFAEQEPLLRSMLAGVIDIGEFKSDIRRQSKIVGLSMAKEGIEECFGISDIQIAVGLHGKPEVVNHDAIHFNISHSGDWIVVAIADRVVGLDIEFMKRPRLMVAERYFTERESLHLLSLDGDAQRDYFFFLWTAKESFLKYLGTGLTKSLSSFDVSRDGDRITIMEDGEVLPLILEESIVGGDHRQMLCYHR